jgi:ethanolamine utilization protein EutM
MQFALGLIETKGLIGAIEAADAMAKAASVKIINKEKSTAALITIKIEGEVAAVKSAIEAGAVAAQRVGQLVSSHIIPRPHADLDFIIHNTEMIAKSTLNNEKPSKPKAVKTAKKISKDFAEKQPATESESVKTLKGLSEEEHDSMDEKSPDRIDNTEDAKSIQVDETISESDSDKEITPTEAHEQITIEEDSKTHLERLREEAKSELDSETLTLDLDESESTESELPSMDELEKLNVHELRKMARAVENFPIKGREISKANRGLLLDYFANL